jgi:7,8-dihydropterin-6-yl-methyl-4-(beta-D-ribofuranosyl)aminobenzene 5'-phosphate synthase
MRMITVYDNTAYDPSLACEWGFGAWIEHGEHTFLFDTGGDGTRLMRNMEKLGLDPQRVETVILSHEHSDHTGGLLALLNTGVEPTVYLLKPFPASFKKLLRRLTTVVEVQGPQEIFPGVYTTGDVGGFPAEQALVVETPEGAVVVTGCAHPGIVRIVRQAHRMVAGEIALVVGGFHLGDHSQSQVRQIISEFREMGVRNVSPTHCTGENAIATFAEEYGEGYIEGGAGQVYVVGQEPQAEPSGSRLGPDSSLTAAACAALELPESACTGVGSNDQWTPVIREFRGVPMALVPAGCYVMGSTKAQVDYAVQELWDKRSWYSHDQPAHEQCFAEPFWIDVYEVSNSQYGLSGWESGPDLPRETVDWFDAQMHCDSRGARLPTESEWEYAARGPDALIFPWGNQFDATLVNYCDANCPREQRDDGGDDGWATLAPVGSYPGGASWVGAMDMSGNVWEWTTSIYAPYPYDPNDGREALNCRTKLGDERNDNREWGACDGPSTRVLRGGSWNYPHKNLLRAADRSWYNPDNWEVFYLGFRCARSIAP